MDMSPIGGGKMFQKSRLRVLFGTLAAGIAGATASAAPLTVTASVGVRAASATFDIDGSDLVVTLTNTSTFDVLEPSEVLTALFFDANTPLVLTPSSAVVPALSTVVFGGTDPGGVVGG